jgi:hypothetical protein
MVEADESGETHWSRTNFTNTFKRKSRRNIGSDTASVTSTVTPERRMSTDRPMTSSIDPSRRSSTDSSTRTRTRRLSNIFTGKRRNMKGGSDVGDGETADGPTSLYSTSTFPSDEGPLAAEDSGNFTEDSDTET